MVIAMMSFVDTHSQQDTTIKVMTTNIRYANPNDGINIWENRKDWLCNLINFSEVDILGGQEVIQEQLHDMIERLPEYSYIGIGRNGGTEGEFCPIFYKTDRYKLLDSDTFWLSENPKKENSKGWDAALPRIVTWVKLEDKTTSKVFYFFNTHFDHKGVQARLESAKLLTKKAKEIVGSTPFFVSGDFNFTPKVEAYKVLTVQNQSNFILKDCFNTAEKVYGPKYTTNGFNIEPNQQNDRIDYIFYQGDISILKHHTVDGQRGPNFISDHFPIIVEARLN